MSDDYGDAVVSGQIRSSEITESSGIVSSKCQSNVYWTHNDSGNGNVVYALDGTGKLLGKWKVTGATNRDWEDISLFKTEGGECFLFIADTGNNGRLRSSFFIYKFSEPEVGEQNGGRSITKKAEKIVFSYPDLRHDSEAIFVHPKTESIYVITKRFSGAAGVYRLVNNSKVAKKIANIEVPSVPNGLITGAGISPDGKRVVLCDYFGGYELRLPDDAKDFDEIWKQQPRLVDLGIREQGEAVAYSADGLSIVATSEQKNPPFIKVSRKD